MVGGPDAVVDMAEAFGKVARVLAARVGEQEMLDKIVHLAVESLDACEYAGISWVEGRRITSPASSNEIPRIVDAIQTEVNEGPCLDAIKDHEVFQTGDLAKEDRWPQFAVRANQETGIASILSLRLFVEKETLGALNLYSTANNAFDDTDVALGSVFAAHAAIAMSSARMERNLQQKADSRDVIGRAKGILMARQHISDDEAFDMLRRASQRLNIKLVAVAEQVSDHASDKDPAEPPRTNRSSS